MYYIMLVETDLGLTAVSYHDDLDEAVEAGHKYVLANNFTEFYIYTGDNTVVDVFPDVVNL